MTQPQPAPRSNRTLLIIIIVLLLLVVCGGAVPVMGILAAIAIPNFVVMQYRAKRGEVPMNVDAIKTAQFAYDATYDTFLEVHEPVPLDPIMLGKMAVAWPSGTAFDELMWQPNGLVRGTYWVEVSPDGMDFTVHGMCDVDGDGEAAHYTATKTTNTTMETSNTVY